MKRIVWSRVWALAFIVVFLFGLYAGIDPVTVFWVAGVYITIYVWASTRAEERLARGEQRHAGTVTLTAKDGSPVTRAYPEGKHKR